MTPKLKLVGGAELSKALAEIGSEVATKLGNEAVRKTAQEFRKTLIAAAPFDAADKIRRIKSGAEGAASRKHLRDSLIVRKVKPRKASRVLYRVGIGDAFWGYFLEYGTAKMAPHPWFRPAWEAERASLAQAQVTFLRAGIERVAKKAAKTHRTVLPNGRNA